MIGLVIEGTIKAIRVHSVFVHISGKATHDQSDELPPRYRVLIVEVKSAHNRHFDKYDQELDYQANTVARGKNKVDFQQISFNQLFELLGKGNKKGPVPDGLVDNYNHLHPHVNGTFEFWVDIGKPLVKDLTEGDIVRLLTLGKSVIVGTFVVLNAKAKDKLTGGWSNQLLVHGERDNTPTDGADKEGVNEEEWDD